MIFNWNSLSLKLKSTADPAEFDQVLKQKFISQYIYETDSHHDCFACKEIWYSQGINALAINPAMTISKV